MQLYRDLPLPACFEILKEAEIADFRWLFDMKNISASKIVFLQPRYYSATENLIWVKVSNKTPYKTKIGSGSHAPEAVKVFSDQQLTR